MTKGKDGKVEFTLWGRNTKTVSLPSFPGSEVTVYTSLLVPEQRQLEEKYKPNAEGKIDPETASESLMDLILTSIKEWNFTVKWEDLKVTMEVLKQFPTVDILVLSEAISGRKQTHTDENGVVRAGVLQSDIDRADLDNKKK